MKILLMLLFLASPVLAKDYYYVEIDTNTMEEISSYGPVTNALDAIEEATGFVRVEVTKAEYEADKDVQPEDRLKNIPAAKIDAAKAKAVQDFAAFSPVKKEVLKIQWEQVKKQMAALMP